jgi:hypothetical protein
MATARSLLVTLFAGAGACACACPAIAAEDVDRVREVLNEVSEDIRVFNEHMTVLASPWMQGRLPGTQGMEYAKDYTEYWFKEGGLSPAIVDPDTGEPSFRQQFRLGSSSTFEGQRLALVTDDGTTAFALGSDFEFTGLGGSGDVEGQLVFIGYSIDDGPEGYQSFNDDTDLEGKVALMLRFEPMNDEGNSRWRERRWSNKATFAHKFGAIKKRNPAAVILVNPPGANDPRTGSLMRGASTVIDDVPVFMVETEVASAMLEAADSEGRDLMAFRALADEGTAVIELDARIEGGGEIKETPQYAENVVGIVPGRGSLKNEYIIIGGHLDHLGFGDFGSRRGSGQLHPGADDNASGSAAVIMLGESLKEAYDESEAEDLRTIVLAAFSAEESGLNGSRYYARNPIFPIEDTSLMINFDMIGRIEGGRLSVSGSNTGVGMEEWSQPFYDESSLEIVKSGMRGGGSDHASFYRVGVPILFGIIADFHDDYHTPDDTIDKINRTDAVKTIHLFHKLAFDAAQRPEKFEFQNSNTGRDGGETRRGPARPRALRVRLGLRSKALADGKGLEVVSVTDDSTAAVAGIEAGDILIKWDKQPLETRADLVTQLRDLKPGDKVQAVVLRDGEEKVLFLTMKAPS